ncbi:hypothetical protein MTQ22_01960 [Corynebacterium bovis]|uniref:Rv3654c family TadE-like protein n=1 Tax=Corynebacterium bovis TaxID=36808 RepID=UPI003138A8E6
MTGRAAGTRRGRPGAGDDGTATVYGAMVMLGLVALTAVALVVVRPVRDGVTAQAAADLAAVSAATVLADGTGADPCGVARVVAGADGAEVVECGTVDGGGYGYAGTGVRVRVRAGDRTAEAVAGEVGEAGAVAGDDAGMAGDDVGLAGESDAVAGGPAP